MQSYEDEKFFDLAETLFPVFLALVYERRLEKVCALLEDQFHPAMLASLIERTLAILINLGDPASMLGDLDKDDFLRRREMLLEGLGLENDYGKQAFLVKDEDFYKNTNLVGNN